jgi:hypothetical protein
MSNIIKMYSRKAELLDARRQVETANLIMTLALLKVKIWDLIRPTLCFHWVTEYIHHGLSEPKFLLYSEDSARTG